MSAVGKSILRQTSLLYRVGHLNITRQTLLPFSTSVRHLAESTSTGTSTSEPPKENTSERTSFDSVPVHISSFGKWIMVFGGLYKRVGDVPNTIPNRVYQKTKDRFRARCVVVSVFATGLLSLVAAMRGKTDQKKGKRFTDDVYNMHRGSSRLHEQYELEHRHRKASERYSPPIDEVNK